MGLIARGLEDSGIATVCVVMNREITENVKPPRALHVHFPYGAPLGPAGDIGIQAEVIHRALALLVETGEPGILIESGTEWPE